MTRDPCACYLQLISGLDDGVLTEQKGMGTKVFVNDKFRSDEKWGCKYKIYRGGKEKHRDVYNTGFIKQQSRELSVTD